MFKLQSPTKYSPFDAINLSRFFFHCSKQVLNMSMLMLFSASAVPLPQQQNVSLSGLFSWGWGVEQKRATWQKIE